MFKSLSDIIQGKDFKIRGRSSNAHQEVFDFLNFVDKWPELVGQPFGSHTLPQKLTHGTLYLVTSHPAFSQGVSFMEKGLIENITKGFPGLKGKIRQLSFIVNAQVFNQAKEAQQTRSIKQSPENRSKNMPHRHSPEFKICRQRAEEIFSDIEDQESKELLISIYIQANFKD